MRSGWFGMKKNNVIFVTIASTVLVVGVVIFIAYQFFSPDIPITTPDSVKQTVMDAFPKGYHISSIRSIQRLSEFEEQHRPMHWLVITRSDKTITTESEKDAIAKPICLALMQKNTDYEGVDVYPSKLLPAGINCGVGTVI